MIKKTFLTLMGCLVGLAGWLPAQETKIEFGRDVRPILADTCYKCHGPDEEHREAGLRLDRADGGIESVVEPGDPESSALLERVFSDDPDLVMPPPDSGRTLTDSQKQILRNWVEEGAAWSQHWSLVPPTRPDVPKAAHAGWDDHPVDAFISRRLSSAGLAPNPPADRVQLIRRVSLDLTGLPPEPERMAHYRELPDADWYEQLVDELLQSPRFGEHQARFWLDAARYGDTHGLHLDNYREMWLYRDWVIQSFNQNLSYRDFVIQQLAGDLLENPTEDQLIATGFNRAHVTTNEGGSISEEVYVRNVVDRVATTGTVFMGLTVGCAQCHDHKFDPISMKDFYRLFAFFNSLDANPMDGNVKDHAPVLRRIDPEGKARIAALQTEADAVRDQRAAQLAAIVYEEPPAAESADPAPTEPADFVWVDDQIPEGGKPTGPWRFVEGPVSPHSGTKVRQIEITGFAQDVFTEATQPLRIRKGDLFFAWVWLDPENPPTEIMLQYNDGRWEHRAYWGKNEISFGQDGTSSRLRLGDLPPLGEWVRLEVPVEKLGFDQFHLLNGMAFSQQNGLAYWDAAGVRTAVPQDPNYRSLTAWLADLQTTEGAGLPADIKGLAMKAKEDRTDAEQEQLVRYFLAEIHPDHAPSLKQLEAREKEIRAQINQVRESYPTTLIWKELAEPKPAYLLKRGEYEQRGDQVERATPSALPPMAEDLPRNRLGLAQWLVDPNHPLTARVAVNRFWQNCFGTGLVETAEDFGAQGAVPSHPELLDWLAVEFMETGWDVKRLLRTIVTSRAYRQSSRIDAEKLNRDPANRLVSRGPRYRLDAEVLRDQALAVSGLLVEKLGGPSVKPPQPDGLWFAVGYSGSNTVRFKADTGPDKVYRRSVYTFWKRTAAPPQMSTFDAPSRESCVVRRERTNTPLQALVLMNEPQYMAAARALARATLAENGSAGETEEADAARVAWMVRRALGRDPRPLEQRVLLESLQQNRTDFAADGEAARQLAGVAKEAEPTTCSDSDPGSTELASWTMVASLIMNMDEFLCKN